MFVFQVIVADALQLWELVTLTFEITGWFVVLASVVNCCSVPGIHVPLTLVQATK
jgi:urea transporter